MKFKTKLLVDRFSSIISQWSGVECVSLNEAALPDTLDPYFALIMDIYYRGLIPGPRERQELYGEDVQAFETSGQGNKDRFLIGNLPVRLEYKSVSLIEELVAIADTKFDSLWFIKDSGTYSFYRLTNGEIIFSQNDWISGIRRRLTNLGDEFWQIMRSAHESKMEHFLGDLGAACMRDDDFFYLISSAGFIKNACLTLFCVNRCFEPSHRAYHDKVLELKTLPDSFPAYLETFLRSEPELTMERKYSMAQYIAKGIVAL
ncbi:MAG: DUF4037 domain-containing protein [Treponema sp.]|nr:DUF4037 domain-containing protein [Treponema sp.]